MREHTPQEVLAGQLSQAVATWADHPENLLKWQLNGPRPPSLWHPEGKEGFARMGHVAVAPSLEAARAGLHVEVCDGVPESWTVRCCGGLGASPKGVRMHAQVSLSLASRGSCAWVVCIQV